MPDNLMLPVMCLVVAVAAGCQTNTSAPARSENRVVAGGAASLDGIRAALNIVPTGVVPADANGWTDAKVDVANRALATEAVGRAITLRLQVGEVIRWEKGHALNGPTREVDELADVDFWIYFQEPSALDAARLNLGDHVTVTGKLTAMRFDQKRPGVAGTHLYVEVDNAELLSREKVASR